MQIMTLILTLLFSSAILANDYIPGEGNFLAEEGDSVSFIKSQLLYEATKDVITKELTNMGLSPDLFWQKYNDKLNSSIEQMDSELKEEYKIGTEAEARGAKEKYRKELRLKTLKKRRRFGNLESVVLSYSIKKQSRASHNPKSRFMKIDAKILPERLTEIYYRFVSGKRSSDYGKLFVQVKYRLKGITFSEMGIENENDFVSELSRNWVEAVAKQRPNNIANIEPLTDDLASKLESIANMNQEEMYRNIPEVFVNSLLMTIYVDVIKKNLDLDHQKADIAYEGGIQLRDLQSGSIVWENSFNPGRQSFDYNNEKDIGQRVINYAYRMPLPNFRSMTLSIEKFSPVSLVKTVKLFNYQNIGQVNSLIRYIEQVGVQYALKAKVMTLTPTSAEVLMQSDSQESDLKTLLRDNQAAKKDLQYELIDSDGTIGIKFTHEPTAKTTQAY